MDTSKNTNNIAGWEIVVAFIICFIAIGTQHYFTSIWGCLASAVFLLIDTAWIISMGRLKRKGYDRQNVSD
ncbi:hypothetical protein AALM74_04425 [Parabacteroides segnis]|uniref:hypothetical protein n=1 Tax=Parabacteroides segnis TaxID=2763058 RepID=UPI0035145F1A